jgi:hypothetical protein
VHVTASIESFKSRIQGQNRLPAILAFALLLVQMWLPWSVPNFVTEDGPSHLYSAIAASDLLRHSHPFYGSIYQFNPAIVPNWTSTILLAVIASIVGPADAEKVMMSLCLCSGFFAFHYAIHALAPGVSRWTPLVNFLLQTWFLGLGFYNFYLGMVLSPLVIGYYVRHAGRITPRRAIVLALGFIGLYFTHLIAAAFGLLAVGTIALWVELRSKREVRGLGLVVAAMLPVLVLFALFAWGSSEAVHFDPQILDAWQNFPMHAFATADNFAGNQIHLWPAVLGFIALAILGMRRAERKTVRGGLALATIAAFATYLIIPERGLGGNQVKIRFVWGVFILGSLLACSVRRLLPLRLAISVYVSLFLGANLVARARAIRAYSKMVDDYLSATVLIPHGASLIRLRYQTPDLPERYGFHVIGRDPLFHLDAYVAAKCRCIDYSDYQAPNDVFPVAFNASVEHDQWYGLWGLEGPGEHTSEIVPWLRGSLPRPIDYVILVADQASPKPADYPKVLANLDSGMQLVAEGGSPPFVHVYKRIANR